MLGLVVIITIVKLTSNVMRKLKHARRLGQCEEHLGSKEGLIPEMSDLRLIPLDSSRCGLQWQGCPGPQKENHLYSRHSAHRTIGKQQL